MRLPLLAAATLLASTIAAHADTYQYTLTVSTIISYSQISFNAPSLITSPTTITDATGFSDVGGDVDYVSISPIAGSCGFNDLFSCINEGFQFGGGEIDFPVDIDTVGTFSDGGYSTLTIDDIPSPASISPEPSTFALLGTGLLGVAGVLKRRLL